MENILIDTDIVIEYLRSRDKASTELVRLLRDDLGPSTKSISEESKN
jgi:predicted nucleic acid-binding protein